MADKSQRIGMGRMGNMRKMNSKLVRKYGVADWSVEDLEAEVRKGQKELRGLQVDLTEVEMRLGDLKDQKKKLTKRQEDASDELKRLVERSRREGSMRSSGGVGADESTWREYSPWEQGGGSAWESDGQEGVVSDDQLSAEQTSGILGSEDSGLSGGALNGRMLGLEATARGFTRKLADIGSQITKFSSRRARLVEDVATKEKEVEKLEIELRRARVDEGRLR